MVESPSSSAQQARRLLADRLAGLARDAGLTGLPNVSLGVIPTSAERSRMPVEGFWIFDSDRTDVELVSGYLTLTQPSEVAMYADTFAELAEMAVYGVNARALIVAALDSLR
ncbi:Scr1 family TA system antitoxin-like transcriptional regulator [Streptomyces californicus]|uniref:Scr1 family TA system antitoxin-like transcriptional regulator n=1 Tax=Streptomyces californicus TaxID=67351 RepID=UPI0037AFD75D